MNKDLQKLIGAAFAIAGVINVGRSFFNHAETIEKKGFTFTSGLALAGLGVLLLSNFDDASGKINDLLS